MKLRSLAVTAALLALAYSTPLGFGQDQGGTATKDQDAAASIPSKPTAPSVEPEPDKVKHEGGKTDVDAVGNRNVGCKTGMGNWYGVEKQIAMGKQYAQQVEASVKLIQDPVVTEYVNRVGQNLVRNSDCASAVHDQGD